ncbi:MAG: hypothetical protein LBV12_07970 [Puniceicoccales bacterium]|jgi:protein-S-isoprenylcysteine O-methyltransferase Ste14|nr:hypothetical protein [Puniceicoccales bacterium]
MENTQPKLISRQGIVIDLALTSLFFVFMTLVLKQNVPWTEAPLAWQWAGAVYASICLSLLFWMAACLFRVTLTDQRLRKKQKSAAQ